MKESQDCLEILKFKKSLRTPGGAVAPTMLKVAKGSKVELGEVTYCQPSPFEACIISWPDVSSLLRMHTSQNKTLEQV